MAREFLFTHKTIHAAVNTREELELKSDDLRNRFITITVKGQGKTNLQNFVTILTEAGDQMINLARVTDLITDEAGATPGGCLIRINFPIYYLRVIAKAGATYPIDITIDGGNY